MRKMIRDTQYVIRNAKHVLRFAFCVPKAYAQEPEEWISPRCVSDGVATLQGFECIFRNIVRILTPVAGLALLIMLVIGSFQLMTAGGEAKKAQKARKTLTSAVFGLVVFLGIWFILKLIQAITGVDVTKFSIPGPAPTP